MMYTSRWRTYREVAHVLAEADAAGVRADLRVEVGGHEQHRQDLGGPGDAALPTRAGTRRFRPLGGRRANTTPPHKTGLLQGLLWKTLRARGWPRAGPDGVNLAELDRVLLQQLLEDHLGFGRVAALYVYHRTFTSYQIC